MQVLIPAVACEWAAGDTPEERLIKAVILRALHDAASGHAEAVRWLFNTPINQNQPPFSFGWCCYAIFADPVTTGNRIRSQYKLPDMTTRWKPNMRRRVEYGRARA